MIVPMILERLKGHLQKKLIDEIAHSDPTRLNAVKIGRFQEDPAKHPLRVYIMGGELDDPDSVDGIVPLVRKNSRIGFDVPAREIGGGQMWYRRGTINPEMYFIMDRVQEEDARERAYTILARIQANIENMTVYDLSDSFGEHAVKMFHVQCSLFQSGGPPNSYLWRGKVYWECLTERP